MSQEAVATRRNNVTPRAAVLGAHLFCAAPSCGTLYTSALDCERRRLMEGACMLNISRLLGIRLLAAALMVGLLSPAAARAADTLGGHFGIVLPLVTRAGGATLSIGSQLKSGFPIGTTITSCSK